MVTSDRVQVREAEAVVQNGNNDQQIKTVGCRWAFASAERGSVEPWSCLAAAGNRQREKCSTGRLQWERTCGTSTGKVFHRQTAVGKNVWLYLCMDLSVASFGASDVGCSYLLTAIRNVMCNLNQTVTVQRIWRSITYVIRNVPGSRIAEATTNQDKPTRHAILAS